MRVEPAGEGAAFGRIRAPAPRTEHCRKGFLRMPAVGSPFDTDQEQAFEWTLAIHADANEDPGYGVSWLAPPQWAKELSLQIRPSRSSFADDEQMGDEGFDQVSAGFFEGFGAAEVSGVGLHESGIEVVLADQKAELVAQTRLTVAAAVACRH